MPHLEHVCVPSVAPLGSVRVAHPPSHWCSHGPSGQAQAQPPGQAKSDTFSLVGVMAYAMGGRREWKRSRSYKWLSRDSATM